MNFRQDIEERYARISAEVEENGGVETPETPVKSENIYEGDHSQGPCHFQLPSQMPDHIYT